MTNQILGRRGEDIAVRFLQGKGYQILERNFKCKLGEIDLVAKDKNTYCFIEVKTRQSLEYGYPFEAVGYYKQRKIAQLALSYLKYRFQSVDIPSRFDVISIHWDANGQEQVQHFVNAFDRS